MERKRKEMIAMAMAAISFILLIAFIPIVEMSKIDSAFVASIILIALVILWIGSTIALIEYSDSGWIVKGSTLEWILAAIFAPGATLFLYLVSKDQSEGESIDPSDHERLRRL